MPSAIPVTIETLVDNIVVEQFWWDGIQVKVPFHCVYAKIPNPVADQWRDINGVSVPILCVENYQIPLCDPLHKHIIKMPNFAVIVSHHQGDKFGLYAYPADHIDEPIVMSYPDWFAQQ